MLYASEKAQAAALQGAIEFGYYVDFDDEKMIDLFKRVRGRMEADAPHLTELVTEVTGHYFTQKGPQDLAIYGAAAMRGMDVLVKRRIA